MSNEVIEIASKHLGQTVSAYSDLYDKSLLVKVPRELNRTAYGIDEKNLPFSGVDVWNAYEVSALTKKGRPVSFLLLHRVACIDLKKYFDYTRYYTIFEWILNHGFECLVLPSSSVYYI